ncbi:hypothetical protein HD554DRAFT_2177598 [Boletus coccyginus]|nr:hypothetical protein HD554DRAFT_2177598 [Boletus coccyginus]
MSDVELTSGDDLFVGGMLDHDVLVDDGEHDVPYDATDVPLRLSANDAPDQREIEAAVYDHGADPNRDDHVALFHNAPVSATPFTVLRRLYRRNDAKGALRLLSGRSRLEIDDHLLVDTSQPDVTPSLGPHYLDLVMYVGDRRGLDAVRPNDRVDHTWRCHLNFSAI